MMTFAKFPASSAYLNILAFLSIPEVVDGLMKFKILFQG